MIFKGKRKRGDGTVVESMMKNILQAQGCGNEMGYRLVEQ